MPKRLSDNQKEEIIKRFKDGTAIDQLSIDFGFTKLTISRNLKKSLGNDLFNNLLKNIEEISKSNIYQENNIKISKKNVDKIKHNNFEKIIIVNPQKLMKMVS